MGFSRYTIMGLMKDSSVRDVPIVIATKTAKCLPVLLASIDQYVPQDVTVFVSGSELWASAPVARRWTRVHPSYCGEQRG